METKTKLTASCCEQTTPNGPNAPLTPGFPMQADPQNVEVCCGKPPAPPSSLMEKPGYQLQKYVTGFMDTTAGPVPQVKTGLDSTDRMGSLMVRLGIRRDEYKIAPGIYAVGRPDAAAPVLVSSNYKLSFDILRKSLARQDIWILVLDTRGINVWCAAGKQLFSTDELMHRVRATRLEKIVSHRRLILPQLSATGVSAQKVKKGVGFEVIWGPVRAEDIGDFLIQDNQATTKMRRVTFSILERVVLIPVEISQAIKPTLGFLIAILLLSGVGTDIFSLQAGWQRGTIAFTAYLGGLVSGAVVTPLLLPWIPARPFAIKGAMAGLLIGAAVMALHWNDSHIVGLTAMLLLSMSVSSYVAMNFTGATPYTSPSGVEKEMRKAIPLQVAAAIITIVLWTTAGFLG